jgi:O-antigen/teichoic acid export membrane protein
MPDSTDGGNLDPTVSADILAGTEAGPAAIRGGTLRVGGYLIGALLSVVSAALLFRHLGVVDTGRYVTVLSLVAIVGGLSDLGLTAVGLREMSVRRGPARSQLAANLLGLRIQVTVVGIAFAIIFAWLAHYGGVLVLGVLLAGVGLLLQSYQATLAISLMSSLKLGWVTVTEVVRQVLTVALIIALVLFGAKLLAFLAVPIPVGVAVLVVTMVLVRSEMPLRPAFERGQWWILLRAVLPYSVAVAAATLYFRIAIILVSIIASARELGYFSVSFRIIEVLLAIPALLVGAAFPIFARAAHHDRERWVYALGRVFQVCLLVGVWMAICLGLGSGVAIAVIGGSQFKPAAAVLSIQGVALAGSFVGAVWAYAMLSLGRHRDILVINVGTLVVGSGLVALLVTLDGARGAAIATAISEVTISVVGALVLLRSHPELAPALGVLPRVALAVVLALTPALVPGLGEIAAVAIATVLYGGALWKLGLVPDELRDHLSPRAWARSASNRP